MKTKNPPFGVVVFSPHFLEKNWTQQEFRALKALQTEKRKVILPIRHNLSIEQLKAKWPIEADAYSISSDEGVAAVADAIRAAVSVDLQNKGFDKEPLHKLFAEFHTNKECPK